MYNSQQVKCLKEAMAKIKEGLAVFEEFCTDDCEHCPLFKKSVCGYHMEFVPDDSVTDALLSNFVDFYDGRIVPEDRMY